MHKGGGDIQVRCCIQSPQQVEGLLEGRSNPKMEPARKMNQEVVQRVVGGMGAISSVKATLIAVLYPGQWSWLGLGLPTLATPLEKGRNIKGTVKDMHRPTENTVCQEENNT